MKLDFYSAVHFVNATFKIKPIKGVSCTVLLMLNVCKNKQDRFVVEILDTDIKSLKIFGTKCEPNFSAIKEAESALLALGINLNECIDNAVEMISDLELQDFCNQVLDFTRDNWSEED